MNSIQSETEMSGPRPAFSSRACPLTRSTCSTDFDTDDTLANIPPIPTDSEPSKERRRLYRLPRIPSLSPRRKRYIWPKSNMPDWLRNCDECDRAKKISKMKIAAIYSGNRDVINKMILYLTPVPRPTRRDIPRFSDFRRGNKFVNPQKIDRSRGERGGGDCDQRYRQNPYREWKDNRAIKSAGRQQRQRKVIMKQKLCEEWQATHMCSEEVEAKCVQKATKTKSMRSGKEVERTRSRSRGSSSVYPNSSDYDDNEIILNKRETVQTRRLDCVKRPIEPNPNEPSNESVSSDEESESPHRTFWERFMCRRRRPRCPEISVRNSIEANSSESLNKSALNDQELVHREVPREDCDTRRRTLWERIRCRRRRPEPERTLEPVHPGRDDVPITAKYWSMYKAARFTEHRIYANAFGGSKWPLFLDDPPAQL